MQIGLKNQKKIFTIGNKVSNGLKLGNKLYNTNTKDLFSMPKVSSSIEDNTGNTKSSLYEPTGILKNNTYNHKKSSLEKHH
jgi:hypothetical protein